MSAQKRANPDPQIFAGLLDGRITPPLIGESTLSGDSAARKNQPLATGVFDYFGDALVAVAEVSKLGNDKHNPGEPLHWARGKGGDNANEALRHFVERGKWDTESDGTQRVLHSVRAAWRMLAIAQLELETIEIMRRMEADPGLSVWNDAPRPKVGPGSEDASRAYRSEDRRGVRKAS